MNQFQLAVVAGAVLLGAAQGVARAQAGVAGAWELNVQAPLGANTITMMVTLDGAKATGTLTTALATVPVTGSATADSIDVAGTMDMQGLSLTLGIKGTLENGALNGSVKMGDFGEAPFTGKRLAVTPAAATAAPAPSPTTGVVGKWNVTLILPGFGEIPVAADFKQQGDAVSGSLVSLLGEVPVTGTFVGSTLKVAFTIEAPTGPLVVSMIGELADQSLAGKAAIAGLGEASWKAVRGQ